MGLIEAPSPNFDERPTDKAVDMLVLHYTGMVSAAAALERMVDPQAKVSAHYMIDEDGSLYVLVPEGKRAWHAGLSLWAGERDINGVSVGIELVNPGHPAENYAGGYRPFPDPQMARLERLARDIVARHRIPARRVLGHSDVAPFRKCDPGELFDWERLARAGVGLAARAATAQGPDLGPGDSGDAVCRLQRDLARFGYGIEATGRYDAATKTVVTAFQRHYRRKLVTGIADGASQGVLADLLDQAGL